MCLCISPLALGVGLPSPFLMDFGLPFPKEGGVGSATQGGEQHHPKGGSPKTCERGTAARPRRGEGEGNTTPKKEEGRGQPSCLGSGCAFLLGVGLLGHGVAPLRPQEGSTTPKGKNQHHCGAGGGLGSTFLPEIGGWPYFLVWGCPCFLG